MSVAKNVLYQQIHLRVNWSIKKEQLEQMLGFFHLTICYFPFFAHNLTFSVLFLLVQEIINLCLL